MDSYIEEFRVNDYSRFNEFYKLTSKQIYFTAYGILKDSMLAEDIIQDTYVTFLEGIDNFKTGHNVYAYLVMIARNKSLNIYNHEKRVVKNDEYFDVVKGDLNVDESYDGVKKILDILESNEEKEVVMYHVIMDLKFKEIAKILDKPLGTVLWIYNKAMKYLKERVKKDAE